MRKSMNNATKIMLLVVFCLLMTLTIIGCTKTENKNSTNDTENQQAMDSQSMTQQDKGLIGENQFDKVETDIKQSGQDDNEQISLDAAKNAALADAGLASSEVTYTKEKLDYEDGITVYEIEFYTATNKYEYEINATSGAVYSKSIDIFDIDTRHHSEEHSEYHNGNTQNVLEHDIGQDEAKNIALNHAGFSASDVRFEKVEYDWEDGQAVYEIEFYKDSSEYEYKINASTGSIIKYDID